MNRDERLEQYRKDAVELADKYGALIHEHEGEPQKVAEAAKEYIKLNAKLWYDYLEETGQKPTTKPTENVNTTSHQ